MPRDVILTGDVSVCGATIYVFYLCISVTSCTGWTLGTSAV